MKVHFILKNHRQLTWFSQQKKTQTGNRQSNIMSAEPEHPHIREGGILYFSCLKFVLLGQYLCIETMDPVRLTIDLVFNSFSVSIKNTPNFHMLQMQY